MKSWYLNLGGIHVMFTKMFIPLGLIDITARKNKMSLLVVKIPSEFIAQPLRPQWAARCERFKVLLAEVSN